MFAVALIFCSAWKASSSTAPEVFCSTRSTSKLPPMTMACVVFFTRLASPGVYSELIARTAAVLGVWSWM